MAAPNSRESLIEYAQRSLGHPVITINVDNEQCEDRLDDLELVHLRSLGRFEKLRNPARHPVSEVRIPWPASSSPGCPARH